MLLRILCALCAAYFASASSTQRKYDGSTLSYDPKGRMYQVEYAIEATRRGGTVVGVCADGCVALLAHEPLRSSSLRTVSHGGVWTVDSHVGIVASGLRSDVQYVVDCARTWCSEHRFVFGSPMPCQMLARRIGDLVHSCTTRGGRRPLAIDLLVGGVDEHAGPSLHQVQATGVFQRFSAIAAGGASAKANAYLAATASAVAAAVENEHCDERAFDPVHGVDHTDSHGHNSIDCKGDDGEGGDHRGHHPGRQNELSTKNATLATASGARCSPCVRGRTKEAAGMHTPTLTPGQHAAVKRALSALSGSVTDPADRRDRRRFETVDGGKAPETVRGLMASDLSARLYALPVPRDGSEDASDVEGNDSCGRSFDCSTAYLADILLELDREDRDAGRI